MDLHHSITKAFSVAAFFGLALAPQDGSRGIGTASASGPVSQINASSALAPTAPIATGADPTATAPLPSTPQGQQGPCAAGMLLVEGESCPDAEEVCLHWLDPPPYQNLRCGEYAKPSKCKVPRVHRRFCVDREEYAEPPSQSQTPALPAATSPVSPTSETAPTTTAAATPARDPKDVMPIVYKTWTEAKTLCEARGARLCKEAEWEFACEGPEMSPYPYGWKRDSSLCNNDKTNLGGPEEKLNDLRAPLSAYPECMSPFGVHDMIGNVDEWAEREGIAAPNRSSLRGGWWLPGRNRCRAATTAHPETYSGKQVGFRCCKDAPAVSTPTPAE